MEIQNSLYYTFKSSRFGTEHKTRYVYSPRSVVAADYTEPLTIIFIHGFGGNADQVIVFTIRYLEIFSTLFKLPPVVSNELASTKQWLICRLLRFGSSWLRL